MLLEFILKEDQNFRMKYELNAFELLAFSLVFVKKNHSSCNNIRRSVKYNTNNSIRS